MSFERSSVLARFAVGGHYVMFDSGKWSEWIDTDEVDSSSIYTLSVFSPYTVYQPSLYVILRSDIQATYKIGRNNFTTGS